MYNVANYIQACVDSILAQDYDNYEIILVNDGSTDSTEQKCKIYNDNKRVKYFSKENGGLSDARNYGINKSTGDYLLFIDSDDFYKEVFLSKINNILLQKNPDILILNSYKYYKLKEKFIVSHPQHNISSIDEMLKKGVYKACAWDKVIKRSFLEKNQLYFSCGMLSEDILWCGEILKKNPHIVYYEHPVYSYRQREDSISKSVSPKHITDIFLMIDDLLRCDVTNYLLEYISFEYAALLYYISLQDKINRENLKQSFMRYDYLLEHAVTKKARIVYMAYRIFGYDFTCLCLKCFGTARSKQ